MPKNSQKVVFKRIFISENGSFFALFLSLSALKLQQLISSSSCAGFVGIGG